jgi:hypothetical protein
MSDDHTISPYEYTDEEILAKVHALRRHGHGTLTLAAYEHKITEMEELNRHRKVPRAGTRSA